jgi:putative serine protease PepD
VTDTPEPSASFGPVPGDPFAPPPSHDPWASGRAASPQPGPSPEPDPWPHASPEHAPTELLPPSPVDLREPIDTLGRPLRPKHQPRLASLVAGGLVIALVAGGAGGAVGTWLADRGNGTLTDSGASLGAVPPGTLSRPPDSVAGIAQRVLPTVVSIDVAAGASGDTGSGFILRADGYILTNNHVVAAAAAGGQITVQFNDGSTVSGKIVGRSPSYDLAVVKVARTRLPVAVLGNSDAVVVGDQSIAIGSPLGLAGTVTAGIVSAINRPVTTGASDGAERSYLSAIQTDAAINPGNSGGPLVDGRGRVIGVNSAIATLSSGTGQTGSIGVGFSIPINQARRVAEQIIRTGSATYPVIGASLDPAYTGPGVRVLQVAPGGPAASAGLRPGDIVTAADGRGVGRPEELVVAIRTKQPGDVIRLEYRRAGKALTAAVTLGSRTG